MATPWTPPQRQPAERSWLGVGLLIAVPLLSLALVRMVWSGSSLWFLMVGIILLGAAAVFFLASRPPEGLNGQQTLAREPGRAPLILTGLGVLFLAMLLLPNFADGESRSDRAARNLSQPSVGSSSEVSGVQEAPIQQPAQELPAQDVPVQQPAQEAPAQEPPLVQDEVVDVPVQETAPVEGQLYIVQDGDNLWDIALRFGTTVDAIVAANELEDPEALQLGDELIIPTATEAPEAANIVE